MDGPRYTKENAISLGMETFPYLGIGAVYWLLRYRNKQKQKMIDQGATNNGKGGEQVWISSTTSDLLIIFNSKATCCNFLSSLRYGMMSKSDTPPTIHLQTSTCNELCFITGQEQTIIRHIRRMRESPKWDIEQKLLHVVFRVRYAGKSFESTQLLVILKRDQVAERLTIQYYKAEDIQN